MSELVVVLGSRSPRRRELLSLLVPEAAVWVLPPSSSEEAGFAGLTDLAAIETRLREIAETKLADVTAQVRESGRSVTAVLTADTVGVITDDPSGPIVLGQPPEVGWEDVVQSWFREHYAGRTHSVFSAVCVQDSSGNQRTAVIESRVTIQEWETVAAHLDWYLSTREPIGKAGGYAIQGAGSVFVSHIEGSFSNIVGLPLELVKPMLEEAGIHVSG